MKERVIKFRAWDTKKKEWANLSTSEVALSGGTLIVGESIEHGTHDEFNSFELMQFTGLKDKNDVEIYESDIVMYDNSYPGSMYPDPEPPEPHNDFAVIRYDNERALFYCDSDFKSNRDGGNSYSVEQTIEEFGSLEIIGNIHENTHDFPELLSHTEAQDKVAKVFKSTMEKGHGAEIAKGVKHAD